MNHGSSVMQNSTGEHADIPILIGFREFLLGIQYMYDWQKRIED